jgi:hypothetical protein
MAILQASPLAKSQSTKQRLCKEAVYSLSHWIAVFVQSYAAMCCIAASHAATASSDGYAATAVSRGSEGVVIVQVQPCQL